MKYFTADWHVGEKPAANTHSLLRVKDNEILVKEWIDLVNNTLTDDDELWFVGDLAITLDDLDFVRLIKPKMRIILGDKETNSKHFSLTEFNNKICEINKNIIISWSEYVTIQDINFQVVHKPIDCINFNDMPSICGHVHGIWRTQKTDTGKPLLNVGIDAWGRLVTEDLIIHQYNAVVKGYYDENCFVNYKPI